MKQFLLLSLLAVSLSNQAQVWCTPNSSWHFPDYSMFDSGYKRMNYLYDTTIAGQTCNKIREFRIGKTFPAGYYNYTRYFYTHVSNQMVYLLDLTVNPPGFDTLYDFNAVPGDKWRMAPVSHTKCAASYVTVSDTGHVTIQGQYLKSFTLTPTLAPPVLNFSGLMGAVYERIGAVDMYPYLFGNVCPISTDANRGGPLRCFSDQQITGYTRNYTGQCEYMYVGMDEPAMDRSGIRLYPNPAKDHLLLEMNAEAKAGSGYAIHNILGKQVQARNTLAPLQSIDISTLPAGIYFLQLNNGQAITLKFIKE